MKLYIFLVGLLLIILSPEVFKVTESFLYTVGAMFSGFGLVYLAYIMNLSKKG